MWVLPVTAALLMVVLLASALYSVPGPARIEFSIWLQAPSRDLGPNEGASFSRAIEITAAVLS